MSDYEIYHDFRHPADHVAEYGSENHGFTNLWDCLTCYEAETIKAVEKRILTNNAELVKVIERRILDLIWADRGENHLADNLYDDVTFQNLFRDDFKQGLAHLVHTALYEEWK